MAGTFYSEKGNSQISKSTRWSLWYLSFIALIFALDPVAALLLAGLNWAMVNLLLLLLPRAHR